MAACKLLSGYRVLDMSQYIPGPYAARSLADLGAEVIKIEPPSGDPMRGFMCQQREGGVSRSTVTSIGVRRLPL